MLRQRCGIRAILPKWRFAAADEDVGAEDAVGDRNMGRSGTKRLKATLKPRSRFWPRIQSRRSRRPKRKLKSPLDANAPTIGVKDVANVPTTEMKDVATAAAKVAATIAVKDAVNVVITGAKGEVIAAAAMGRTVKAVMTVAKGETGRRNRRSRIFFEKARKSLS